MTIFHILRYSLASKKYMPPAKKVFVFFFLQNWLTIKIFLLIGTAGMIGVRHGILDFIFHVLVELFLRAQPFPEWMLVIGKSWRQFKATGRSTFNENLYKIKYRSG